ncbi:MAG: 2-amino-4-hydroxy-6-hydroxymethyldihydropteridine diphosphokinase [Deltaproteobacteria bacterium]|nr:2-amino-4-hydroxy-6-hydroxymethyldihydropteridine diphosphokinase [Deltaproteobacteria bacterium]
MGDPAAMVSGAVRDMDAADGCGVVSVSRLYRTEPVGYEDQGWFVNACVEVSTSLAPRELLALARSLEEAAGRERGGIKDGPRPLDVDILFYGGLVMDEPGLCIPHPRAHKRRFVLAPLCDIAPHLRHPLLGKTARELLAETRDRKQVIPCS